MTTSVHRFADFAPNLMRLCAEVTIRVHPGDLRLILLHIDRPVVLRRETALTPWLEGLRVTLPYGTIVG